MICIGKARQQPGLLLFWGFIAVDSVFSLCDNFYLRNVFIYPGKDLIMEQHIVTITVKTHGEDCEMSDAEILKWYKEKVDGLFDKTYGTPEITVDLKRNKTEE